MVVKIHCGKNYSNLLAVRSLTHGKQKHQSLS